jgi:predicted nucleotide-binding protein
MMTEGEKPDKVKTVKDAAPKKKYRNFPRNTLADTLAVAQKITDERAGKPFKRLLLADALGTTPSSSNFHYLLSSSFQYGLTEGTEKATEVTLTQLGEAATQSADPAKRTRALRQAALRPSAFDKFFKDYGDKKLPSVEMLGKILTSDYAVPDTLAEECATLIVENGRFVGIIREIGGSPHVIIEAEEEDEILYLAGPTSQEVSTPAEPNYEQIKAPSEPKLPLAEPTEVSKPKPIFIGHGKNKSPLEKLQKLLSSFQIPYRVTTDEANLGRPIPQKVKDTMLQCGSAILIFTCDEKFYDAEGKEIWRPSENVVHELGASSFVYGDRIVIFKERGLHFPTNFQSIGYIEFDVESIESKTAELLKELVGFGLVKITPA